MPKVLTIDYETRSPIDIKKCGAYAYAASKYTEPMMLAVKCDEDDARMWIAEIFRHLMDTEVSDEELEYLINSAEVLVAHNAFFERSITRFHMPFDLPLEKVRCTMAQACMCGLPRDLDSAAKIVSGGKYLKDKDGHTLMLSMSKPRRLVKSDCEELIPILNNLGYPLERSEWKKIQVMQKNLLETISLGKKPEDERLLPYFLVYRESQEEFVRLVEYARQDVRVEYMLYMNLPKIPESELKVWQLDQQINDRGVQVDVCNAEGIVKTLDDYTDTLEDEALAITDYQVTSVKSPSSILAWLGSNGVETTSIDKETIKYLLTLDLDPKVRKFLELRQALGKSSVAKYDTLLAEAFYDGRCHGLFVYHGAGTGRWAGAGVQPQNLPRPAGQKNLVDATMFGKDDEVYADELDAAMLASGDIDLVRMFWKDPMVLSADLIRTMFMAPEGKELVCADFSAVEARGIAWLSGQESLLDAFRQGLDIYKVSASGIFKIPYGSVDGGGKGDQRQIGKTATLACVGEDTLVLTKSRGYVPITEVLPFDEVWDGEKWVETEGVISRGPKPMLSYAGVKATPDHIWYHKTLGPLRTDRLTNVNAGIREAYDLVNCGDKHRFQVWTKEGVEILGNCGYGGGWNAMLRFGADKFGLTEEEGTAIVKAWREANNKIVEFWYALTRASVDAMRSPGERFYAGKYISFQKLGKFLTMRLPSGRDLYYPFPKLEDVEMPWSTEAKPAFKKVVTAMTQNMAKQWVREPLSHVKLSENATQATCRDLLVNAMFNVTKAGYDVVMHIHDEIVAEIDEGKGNLAEFESLMTKLPEWAKGLPLKAEGWIGKRYRK